MAEGQSGKSVVGRELCLLIYPPFGFASQTAGDRERRKLRASEAFAPLAGVSSMISE